MEIEIYVDKGNFNLNFFIEYKIVECCFIVIVNIGLNFSLKFLSEIGINVEKKFKD